MNRKNLVKTIALGADHGGFELKNHIKDYLMTQGYKIKDFGTFAGASINYAPIAHLVAKYVQEHKSYGIVVCGSGIGMAITCNRHENIRCAVARNEDEITLARQHNDVNVLALGGRITSFAQGVVITKAFLQTNFEGGRHIPRVKSIDQK